MIYETMTLSERESVDESVRRILSAPADWHPHIVNDLRAMMDGRPLPSDGHQPDWEMQRRALAIRERLASFTEYMKTPGAGHA